MQITLPDGSEREYPDGASGLDVASSIGSRLAKAAVAVRFDGELRDLTSPLPGNGALEIITEATEFNGDTIDVVITHEPPTLKDDDEDIEYQIVFVYYSF